MTPDKIESMPEPAWLPDEIERIARQSSGDEDVEGEIYVLLTSMVGNKAAIPANERVQKMFLDIHVLLRSRLMSALRNAYPAFNIVHCWTEDENGILVAGFEEDGISEERSREIAEGVEDVLDICYEHCMMEMNDGLN